MVEVCVALVYIHLITSMNLPTLSLQLIAAHEQQTLVCCTCLATCAQVKSLALVP